VSAARTSASFAAVFLILFGLVSVVQHFILQSGAIDLSGQDGFTGHLAEYSRHSTMEFLHLAPSFVFFLIAPLQFIGSIRAHHPLIHRILGRTYVVLGLTSGLLGLLISIVFPFGGLLESVLVIPFGIFFLYAVTQGFLLARARKIAQHRAWMIRGLATAMAISTQRLFLGVLMIGRPMDEMPEMFNVAIVLGFLTTIGLAELYIRRVPLPRLATAAA
jgi:uncharacterized membrane protein